MFDIDLERASQYRPARSMIYLAVASRTATHRTMPRLLCLTLPGPA